MFRAFTFGLSAVLLATAGLAQAAPTEYVIESNHTYPSFTAPHIGISFWRGKFNKTSGSVMLDTAAATGSVDITIDASTVDFGHEKMNEHARGEDFFNVAEYPTITYSGEISFDGATPVAVDGELTMLGVSKPVPLKINSFKCIEHPMLKVEVCGADATASFDRTDFGMDYGASSGTGVELQIQVEALKKP